MGGQEGEGVSPTAIREIMLLREMRHPHIVLLEATLLTRQARLTCARVEVQGLRKLHSPQSYIQSLHLDKNACADRACNAPVCVAESKISNQKVFCVDRLGYSR